MKHTYVEDTHHTLCLLNHYIVACYEQHLQPYSFVYIALCASVSLCILHLCQHVTFKIVSMSAYQLLQCILAKYYLFYCVMSEYYLLHCVLCQSIICYIVSYDRVSPVIVRYVSVYHVISPIYLY